VAAVGLGSPKARGDDFDWYGFGVNGNWSTPANWGGFLTPSSGDFVIFGDISTALVNQSVVDTTQTVYDFHISGPSAIGDYTFIGPNTTLTVSDQFQMLQPNPVKDNATIGSGLTVDAAAALISNDSHLTIGSGGTLIAEDFEMQPSSAAPTPTVVISNGGTLRMKPGGNFFMDNGTLELDSGGALNMDSGVQFLVQNSGSTLQLKTNWAVPAGATVKAALGGHITSTNFLDVGNGSSGTFIIDGSGSSATIGTQGDISDWGATGSATVTFSNSATGSYLGIVRVSQPGGTANVNINTGATLTVAKGLFVGGFATSAATITLNSATLAIGNGTTAFSEFASGSTFNFQSGTLQLAGTLQFDAGSQFNWSGGTITGTGNTILVDGGVASLTNGVVGLSGNTISVSTAGQFTANTVNIAVAAGQTGTLLVDGAGTKYSTTAVAGNTAWGQGGSATVTISGGGVATLGNQLQLGVGGAAVVSLLSGGSLQVPNVITTFAGGAATLNINGGTLNTGTANFSAGAQVNLSSGGFVPTGNATFSSGSTFNWSGGSLSIASGKTLTFDASTATITTGTGLSNGATVHVTDAAHVTHSLFLDFGSTDDGGANGTLLIDGAGSSYTTTATVGNYTDFGLNNGDFGTLTISNSGAGTFTALHLAGNGGKAMVTLSSGSLNIGTVLQAGSSVASSAATINISGGKLTTTGTANFLNGAVVNLSAGTWTLNSATFGAGSTLNWSNGNLNLSGTLSIIGGTASLTNGVSLQFQNGSTLSVGTNGLYQTNSALIVGTAGTGTIIVDGANAQLISNVTIGSSIFGGGNATSALLKIADGGAATFASGIGGGLNASNGAAQISVGNNGGTLTANYFQLGTSTLQILGGAVNILNDATFSGGAVGTFSAGSMSVGGTLTTKLNAQLTMSNNVVLRTHALSMSDTSIINLAAAGLIDDYTGGSPLSTIRGYILNGRNGGLNGVWKGAGINSSTAAGNSTLYAVGYADASAIGSPATFMGQSIDNTSVLVRLTYNGDANLDGKVNALDFNALATNFGKTPGSDVWTQGDFNYDGNVNTQDFMALVGNFNATPLSAPPVLGTLVPEPAAIATIAAICALASRRRKLNPNATAEAPRKMRNAPRDP
jgi:hypothetical protein